LFKSPEQKEEPIYSKAKKYSTNSNQIKKRSKSLGVQGKIHAEDEFHCPLTSSKFIQLVSKTTI
jgi:hypothetical protein